MKQVFQDVTNGQTLLRDVPRPRVAPGHVLIRTTKTLISAGTERSMVDFGRAGWIDKARQQPDKVRMVLNKARTDGVVSTVEAVRSKLAQPLAMGYSNVGVVVDVGSPDTGFAPGDRVLSNGGHAEFVSVPKNLCAHIPEGVDDETATFGVLGAIALQGIRLVEPTLGETVVVTGLGLIGLMTVQLLRASGCRVIGIDMDPQKLDLASGFGAHTVRLDQGQDPVMEAERITRGQGVDAVIITASSKSDEIVHQAATMCRQRGRIVLVGVVGLQLNRSDFYEKELTFQVSCSYGPGRYDPRYEDEGHDYPLPFVRWTENRNFQAVLEQMALGQIQTGDLVSARYAIEAAPDAYELLVEDRTVLGVVLDFPGGDEISAHETTVRLVSASGRSTGGDAQRPVVGAIGAGNYAGRVLLPAFAKAGARLKGVVSAGGRSGDHVARSLGFEFNGTDASEIFDDPEVNTVVVGTRHDSHAELVKAALDAGKHVFVEKPLALSLEEVEAIEDALSESGKTLQLMVGFNRRFAPLVVDLKTRVARLSGPMTVVYTCNAGAIPADSWVHDPKSGGGRIVGEACHFLDLARFLVGHPVVRWTASPMRIHDGVDLNDTASVTMEFEDGSLAVVNYLANGHRAFPKERIEVFRSGSVFSLDNFRRLRWFGKSSGRRRAWRQDKGQGDCVKAFLAAVSGEAEAAIPVHEILEISRLSIEVAEAARAES